MKLPEPGPPREPSSVPPQERPQRESGCAVLGAQRDSVHVAEAREPSTGGEKTPCQASRDILEPEPPACPQKSLGAIEHSALSSC